MTKQIREDLRAEIEQLVRLGMEGVDTSHVSVHLKGSGTRVRYRVEHDYGDGRTIDVTPSARIAKRWRAEGRTVERVERHRRFHGRAYEEIPERSRAKGSRYLIVLNVPLDPEQLDYPYEWQYKKRAPVNRYQSWQEELVHLAAHEAKHIEQYREGLPRSEVSCEFYADGVLKQYRASLPLVTNGHVRIGEEWIPAQITATTSPVT